MQKSQSILANAFILGVHQHLVEKQIDLRAKRGDRFERLAIPHLRYLPARGDEGGMQAGFGTRFEQSGVDQAAFICELRLLQNIANAFEARGKRFEIGRGAHGLNSGQTLFDVDQVIPAGSEDGVDFVVLESADIAEVIADAIEQERLDLGRQELSDGKVEFPFY